MAVIGQTPEIAPADGKLYALRDVTATVDCLPLIASSILCKKLAEGIEALVLDVKVGRGAFMKRMPEAETLSCALVEGAINLGTKAVALITDMGQPLGEAIGNSLEVKEAIRCLKGEGPADIEELTLELGSWMLLLGGEAESLEGGREKLKGLWRGGFGLQKFEEWVEAQGGNPTFLLSGRGLPQAGQISEVKSTYSGFVQEIEAEAIGLLARDLGAGRRRLGDHIDPAAGILLRKKVGQEIQKDEVLAQIHANKGTGEIERRLEGAFRIGPEKPAEGSLIRKVIERRPEGLGV